MTSVYQGGLSIATSDDEPWLIEPGGLILTKNFLEQFSMDADFVIGIIENEGWSIVSNIGLGYFFTPWFQAVIEGAFAYEDTEGEDSKSLINITAGFTAPVTDRLTIILGVTPDVYTNNTDKEVVITSAFTFLF